MMKDATVRFAVRLMFYTVVHWCIFIALMQGSRHVGLFISEWSPLGVAAQILGLPFVTLIERTEGIIPGEISRVLWQTLPVLSWVNSLVWAVIIATLMNRVEKKRIANISLHGTRGDARP
jgi:hypothetical protein